MHPINCVCSSASVFANLLPFFSCAIKHFLGQSILHNPLTAMRMYYSLLPLLLLRPFPMAAVCILLSAVFSTTRHNQFPLMTFVLHAKRWSRRSSTVRDSGRAIKPIKPTKTINNKKSIAQHLQLADSNCCNRLAGLPPCRLGWAAVWRAHVSVQSVQIT